MEKVRNYIIVGLIAVVSFLVIRSFFQSRKIQKLMDLEWESKYNEMKGDIEAQQIHLDSLKVEYWSQRDSLQVRIDNYEKFVEKITSRRYSASDVVRIGREIFGTE